MFQLRVDTGGTFTDCWGRAENDAEPRLVKVLSSGRLRVSVQEWISPTELRIDIPEGWHTADTFFTGYKLQSQDQSALVLAYTEETKTLTLSREVPQSPTVDLFTREEAPILGARLLTGTALDANFPPVDFRLATTRGTNALLERKGARVAFFVTKGFGDLLIIRDQRRPDLFALKHERPRPLYEQAIEIHERLDKDGHVLAPITLDDDFDQKARALLDSGIDTAAVALLHSYQNPEHEHAVRDRLLDLGFTNITLSSEIAPLIKILPRAETSVVNAYLQPIMQSFLDHIQERAGENANLLTMTSAGGLETVDTYCPKDSLLSGPAGGVSGAAAIAEELGYKNILTFDMGGTSTDVARYADGFQYRFEQIVGDARLLSPALKIETVASGGGSICHYTEGTLRVGPESAGADPGPACYGRGGPLTITDVNLLLGRIDPANFGIPLSDENIAAAEKAAITLQTEAGLPGDQLDPAFLTGLLEIAVEQMADAIRAISIRDGADPTDYALLAFGGAGPLHACDIAERLEMKTILVPAEAGLLSAYGLHCASIERFAERQLDTTLTDTELEHTFTQVENEALQALSDTGHQGTITRRLAELRLEGQDSTLTAEGKTPAELETAFQSQYQSTFGYPPPTDRNIQIVSYRAVAGTGRLTTHTPNHNPTPTPAANQPTPEQPNTLAPSPIDPCREPSPSPEPPTTHSPNHNPTPTPAANQPTPEQPNTLDPSPIDPCREPSPTPETPTTHSPSHNPTPSPAANQPTSEQHTLDPCSLAPCREPSPTPETQTTHSPNHNPTLNPAANQPTSEQHTLDSSSIDPCLEASPFIDRSTLQSGHTLTGPKIVQDPFSTLYLKPNWTATLADNGSLILTHTAPTSQTGPELDRPEQIVRELFRHRFDNLVEEMGNILQRSAISTNVKERADFSCALLDGDGYLISSAPHIPVHLGALGMCVRMVREQIQMMPGDTIITNHPAVGGSHLPDVTLITPVFSDDNQQTPVAYIANRAHHAEIGGITPGSMPPAARNLAEEGVVISPTHLIKQDESQFDQVSQILTNAPYPTRRLSDNLADLNAQLASNRRGKELLQQLLHTHGPEFVASQMETVKHQSLEALTEHLQTTHFTHAEATEHLDDGTPIQIRIENREGRLQIDFTGTGPVLHGNLNATPAIVQSALLYSLRLWIQRPVALNEGLLSQVDIHLPESFLNPTFAEDPTNCPAVVGGNVEASQRLVDTILKALQVQACSQGTMNNFLFGDDTFGYYETICGGSGAGEGYDGTPAIHTHMTNTAITDPEILEQRYPVRLHQFAIRKGSGGNGTWKGGDGVIREIEFLKDLQVSLLTQHRKEQPYGLGGGEAGKCGEQRFNGDALDGIVQANVNEGDCLVIETPGGGGYSKR